MQTYKNLGGNSGVRLYEIGTDYIDIIFSGSLVYRYSYKSPGKTEVEHMKKLALQGQGLNSYISRCIRSNYEKKYYL